MEKFSSELPFPILLMADPERMEVDSHCYSEGICWQPRARGRQGWVVVFALHSLWAGLGAEH